MTERMSALDSTLRLLQPRSLTQLTGHVERLVRSQLWAKILLALVLGVGTGVALSEPTDWVPRGVAEPLTTWLAFPGQIFLGVIQMVVLPLIVASIICGIAAGENVAQLKRLGVRMALFVFATTSFSATLGIVLCLLLEPGSGVARPTGADAEIAAVATGATPGFGPETLLRLLPENPLESMVSGEMLPIVLFALIVGIAVLGVAPERARPIIDLLEAVQSVCMQIIGWAMHLAPFAVFGLTASIGSTVGLQAMLAMAYYVAVASLGFAGMLAMYTALAAISSKRNPWKLLTDLREVQLLAFSTSSSAAVMPLSMQTAEHKLGVSGSTAQFLIPLGVTVNMTGSALSMSVATVFLAQVFGVVLALPDLALIVATAVGASIGSPGVPGVGMGILAMILADAGIPAAGIPLILGVDRIVDMMRTVVNVTGDLTACLLFDQRAPVLPPHQKEAT